MKNILLTSMLCASSLLAASNYSSDYSYEVTPFVSGILTDSKAGLEDDNYFNGGISLGKNINESFIDQIEIQVIAGNGGNGCIAFRREKFVPFGGPAGGDGGRGGDVVFVADPGLGTLYDLYYVNVVRADDGGHGQRPSVPHLALSGNDCAARQTRRDQQQQVRELLKGPKDQETKGPKAVEPV